jgi:hypothetical protein
MSEDSMNRNRNSELDQLAAIIPPPSAPSEVDPAQRHFAEEGIGSRLPEDYCAFAMLYGTGAFETDKGDILLVVLNPLSRIYLKEIHTYAATIRDRQLSSRTAVKRFQTFPQIPGLIPVGSGESQRLLCWYREDHKQPWPLFFFPPNEKPAKRYDQYFTAFLFDQLSGKGSGFGGSWSRKWLKDNAGSIRFVSHPGIQPRHFPDLHVEASAGRSARVQELLRSGNDPNEADYEKRTPLFHAIDQGDVQTIRLLLQAGATPAIPDMSGTPPLHEAMRMGLAEEGIEALLEHGASPDSTDESGCSALARAVMYGNSVGVAVLLRHGANVHSRDQSGASPLSLAGRNKKIQKMLLAAGATH